jgi:hypothetical protein
MSRDAGAQPVLLILPNASHVSWSGVPAMTSVDYRASMRKVAEEAQVPVADGPARYADLPYMPNVFMDPVHPGTDGARILGQVLDRTLREQGW